MIRNATGFRANGFLKSWSVMVAAIALNVLPAYADFYVAPNGSDTNPGTIGAPFLTVQKARDAVKTVNSNMTADIHVFLRGGWYPQTATLTFDQTCSGTNGFNVIFEAYPGERPVISGGRKISGWTLHDAGKNIWKANAPGLETRQLYVDCERAVRAHKGSGIPNATKIDVGYSTSDTSMKNWGNKSDIEIIFNALEVPIMGSVYRQMWYEWRMLVNTIWTSNTVVMGAGWAYGWKTAVTIPSDIENAYELLDQSGEWYLDRTLDVVYYKPLAGQNINQATVIAPVLEELMVGAGVVSAPIHNIQFKGITFAHATWLSPSTNGFVPRQANGTFENTHPGGNVVIKAARAIRFERCVFKHLGREGLELSGGAQHCVVNGCVFTQISANPIRVGTIKDSARADTRLRDTSNQVTNNYIHDSPCEYRDGVGIFAGWVSNLLLAHNEIAYMPYSGISCGWGWSKLYNSYARNNRFSSNYIHHVMRNLGDGAHIYTLSNQPGTVWDNNWLDEVGFEGQALYPDQSSGNMELHHNVCTRVETKWVQIWSPNILNIMVHDNWANAGSYVYNYGSNCPVTSTTYCAGPYSTWPAAAQSIMNNAGLESAYQDIKTLQCACALQQNPGMVNTPVIRPDRELFADSLAVAITCVTPDAAIRYTTNGSEPQATSTLYSAPFFLQSTATVKARAFKSGMTESYTASVVCTKAVQTPFTTAFPIPGKVEAEDYDKGGEGVAYHDLTKDNSGNLYRITEGVDMEAKAGSGGINIGWVVAGEWLEYTINVPTAGNYDIELRLANGGSGAMLHVEFDGVNKTGAMAVPNTGNWDVYQLATKTNVALNAGQQVMRVSFDQASSAEGVGVANLDYINIKYSSMAIGDLFPAGTIPGALVQVGPNPMRSRTTFSLSENAGANARVDVFDRDGRVIYVGAIHELPLPWNGTDLTGQPVAPGVYFYTVTMNGRQETGRIVIVAPGQN